MTGRPTKLTPEIANQIITFIEGGAPRLHAARAVGIAKSTLQAWIARGERERSEPIDPARHVKADLIRIAKDRDVEIQTSWSKAQIADAINTTISPYSDFADRVREADSRFLVYAIGMMRQAGQNDWKMWDRLIERRFPDMRFRSGDADTGDDDWAPVDEDTAQEMLERAVRIRGQITTGDTRAS